MPYGMRVFWAIVGGMLLGAGLLVGLDEVGSGSSSAGPAGAVAGLGLGLLAASFLRRD